MFKRIALLGAAATLSLAMPVLASASVEGASTNAVANIQMDSIQTNQDNAGYDETEQAIIGRIASLGPDATVTSIEESDIKGVYEVVINNSQIIYMASNARLFISGDLFEIGTMGVNNLTENRRSLNRMQLLRDQGGEGIIRYEAPNEKIRVALFTDVDCPYCQKLHHNIDDFLNAGISLDYYAFPRSGPGTPSFEKYVSAWCSEDPKSAMDAAMNRQRIPDLDCENPVQSQYILGQDLGVTGTPSFISYDGQMVQGLVPPEQLLRRLGI